MNVQNEKEWMPLPRIDPAPFLVLLLLIAAVLVGTVLGGLLAVGWCELQGIQLQTALSGLNEQSDRPLRDAVRVANLLNHVAAFTLPALMVAFLLYRRKWASFLKLDILPSLGLLLVGIVFVIASFPFAQVTYWLNQQLPLPEWMKTMEASTQAMVKGLLVMNSPGELALNLLIIAVLPAIGEELVFRGIVQQQLQRIFRKPAMAIWITAIIFSAIHLQFVGFLPRVVLGAALGYLFYWTRSLWAPIIAHFFTNGIQVVAQYLTHGKLTENEMENMTTSNWLGGLISLMITVALGYYLSKSRPPAEATAAEIE